MTIDLDTKPPAGSMKLKLREGAKVLVESKLHRSQRAAVQSLIRGQSVVLRSPDGQHYKGQTWDGPAL
ncbi:MAG: hypothetical protein WAO98_01685 [Alphaproteobacteria bacterium]